MSVPTWHVTLTAITGTTTMVPECFIKSLQLNCRLASRWSHLLALDFLESWVGLTTVIGYQDISSNKGHQVTCLISYKYLLERRSFGAVFLNTKISCYPPLTFPESGTDIIIYYQPRLLLWWIFESYSSCIWVESINVRFVLYIYYQDLISPAFSGRSQEIIS